MNRNLNHAWRYRFARAGATALVMKEVGVGTVAGAGHMVVGDNNAIFRSGVIELVQKYMPVGMAHL